MPEPLSGITVVEMTIAVQGPAAGLYLRDMGAQVIKVEPPLGDASRYGRGRQNETPAGTLGPQFVACNRGKRSVCVDLATEAETVTGHAAPPQPMRAEPKPQSAVAPAPRPPSTTGRTASAFPQNQQRTSSSRAPLRSPGWPPMAI